PGRCTSGVRPGVFRFHPEGTGNPGPRGNGRHSSVLHPKHSPRQIMAKQFDVVVIGAGPGGYIAAIRAAQLGLSVACVDAWTNEKGGPAPGGTCTNVGCIPSKALLQASEHFEQANKHFADHGISVKGVSIDVAKFLERKQTIVKQNNDGIIYLFKKNKV